MPALKPLKGCPRRDILARGEDIPLPCGVSFKIDGIRGMAYDNLAMSTSGKPLPNLQIKEEFQFLGDLIRGLDGELIDGEPNDRNVMQQATHATMNANAVTDFTWWVFDDFSFPEEEFKTRYVVYQARVKEINDHLVAHGRRPFLRAVEYREITTMEEYLAFKQEAAELKHEGLYGKAWFGKYKHGRATPVQRWVWKDKPWTDEEGVIVGFVEMQANDNEAFIDELGRTKRSTAQAGLSGKGLMGSFIVKNPKHDKPFNVSCGTMTMEERRIMWETRDTLMDKLLTYKFFDFGIVDVPRSAMFKCWRSPLDMDYF